MCLCVWFRKDTVDELIKDWSADTLFDWLGFLECQPLDFARQDLRTGVIAATVAEGRRNPKERGYPYAPSDFLKTPYEASVWAEGAEERAAETLAKYKQEAAIRAQRATQMMGIYFAGSADKWLKSEA